MDDTEPFQLTWDEAHDVRAGLDELEKVLIERGDGLLLGCRLELTAANVYRNVEAVVALRERLVAQFDLDAPDPDDPDLPDLELDDRA